MELYVKADSKKALNERLVTAKANNREVIGTNYSMFGGGGSYALNAALPKGTVIKIYSQMSGGNPVAKSYGTWDGTKVK